MHRLMIVDSTVAFGKALSKQLNEKFEVFVCNSGTQALKRFRSFSPDIVFLDLHITDVPGLSLLHSLRAADPAVKLIVMTNLADPYTCRELGRQQVDHAFRKPCSLGAVTACIHDISQQLLASHDDLWCVENEADRILLELCFRFGSNRYYHVHDAILGKYREPYISVTKCLYPRIAKNSGGTATQVEKAIRDAIKDAWRIGNRQIWQLYFPCGKDGFFTCPSNEQFFDGIANILRQKTRVRQPYMNETEKAM